MSDEQRMHEAVFMFPNRDVELPIHPGSVPRVGDRIMWTSHGFNVGGFTVTDVCWHVSEQSGVLSHLDISLDPDDVSRETKEESS